MRLVTSRAFAIFLLLIAFGSQTSLLSQQSRPRISYRIQVDSADLSGFNVEMRIQGAGDTVRIAMAAHPEYDDRYWRYVENLTAESRGVNSKSRMRKMRLWSVRAPRGDLTVKYRIQLPPQTTPNRSAWQTISLANRRPHRRCAFPDVHRRCRVGASACDA